MTEGKTAGVLAQASPSMRREWIEIYIMLENMWHLIVSLHAEGVD